MWSFVLGGELTAPPVIGADCTIFAGAADSKVYAISPDGQKKWEFAAGGAGIALHSGPSSPGRKGPKIVFYAKDVAALRQTLVARGASFGKLRQGPTLCLCDGKDPDGNPIQLSDRRSST
jgi:hypothetical protein